MSVRAPVPLDEAAPPDVARPGAGSLRLALVLVVVSSVVGYLIAVGFGAAHGAEMARPPGPNVFFKLYGMHERPFLALLIVFACFVWWTTGHDTAWSRILAGRAGRAGGLATLASSGTLALATLLVTAAGTAFVMHFIGLSMDESAASFQARIFASGHLAATIPEKWRELAPWMTPIFITYKWSEHLWLAGYLPMYSAIRALFALAHVEWLTNPALAASSVLLLDRVARRMWPGDDRRRQLALVFLVSSSQFLVTSMSGYSMPAHLCLNLLWLLLFLRDDRTGYLALPWVGVLAMGLHNPFPHALFVAPFLLRMVLRRRIAWTAYAAVVYLAGAYAWLQWLHFASPDSGGETGAGGLLAGFDMPGTAMTFVQGISFTLILSWHTPLLAIALVYAAMRWRSLELTERDLLLGFLATFAFYFVFPTPQGHGWGYRYIYGVLGNIMLLGASGTMLAARTMRRDAMRALVAASLLASVALQLPVRLWQVERFVRPMAAGLEFIASRPAAVVAVDVRQGWYVTDLVRNDPLFERGPKVFHWSQRGGPGLNQIPPELRDSVYMISRPQMAHFGIPLIGR